MPRICIIIPVHNRKSHTQHVLSQISQQCGHIQESQSLGTIVVDDGSTDGTAEFISQHFPDVHVLHGDGTLWWTGCIVKGMDYAVNIFDASHVVWLNDDIDLTETFISDLSSLCQSSQYQRTIVGGIIRDRTYPHWVVYSGIRNGNPIRDLQQYSPESDLAVSTLSGNIVVIPRVVIDTIGMPDPVKFPHHGGDFEYIRLAKKNGFKAVSTSRLQAFTEYDHTDLIRYMPYWMQWYLRRSWGERQAILKGLKTLKANQNIWLFVNIQNRDRPHIPKWKYFLCYLDKRLKLFAIDLIPGRYIEPKILTYLETWNVPPEMVKRTLGYPKLLL